MSTIAANETIKAEEKKILFKEGIPGFEDLKTFIILEEGDGVFYYLQSTENTNVAFSMINPYLIKADYAPDIHESYFEKLGGGTSSEFTVFVIATVSKNIDETTVNLQAPILIHTEKRIGVQAIVDDKQYKSRHKIVELIQERGE